MDSLVETVWQKITYPDRVFIIAEAGVNHNGDLETAIQMIDKAVEFKADAIKFQTFKADKLVSTNAPKAEYQKQNTDPEESQYEMLKGLELSESDYHTIFKYCKQMRIIFISTPFDEESAGFLDDLGVELFKVPSGEITNTPFLAHIARKRKPLIVSTGMAKLGEVEKAVETIESTGNRKLVLLHCVSNYPARSSDVNLRAMLTMASAFGTPTGYSDHTEGIEISLAAAALGAHVIEKHFTLDRQMEGPDHKASIEPKEFNNMVKGIRSIEKALGNGIKKPVKREKNTADVARRSIIAIHKIPVGTKITDKLVGLKRPGTGLPPDMLNHILGREVNQTVNSGTPITLDIIK